MHKFVSFHGQIVDDREAGLPAVSSAALYGNGIFTTIAIGNGEPFLWDKHWRRLVADAESLRIDISEYSAALVERSLRELIRHNNVKNGRARITLFDGSSSMVWTLGSDGRTECLIMTGDPRKVPEKFRVKISPYCVNSASPLAGIKSCNYLENVIAMEDANKNNCDEAIKLNERGEVTGGIMSNVFWLADGNLFTPALETGCLPGTTREFVIENFRCEEVVAGVEAMHGCEAVFLTSAGIGIVQAGEFNGRRFEPLPHEILDLFPR